MAGRKKTKPEELAPYWQELLVLSVKRDEDGLFIRTRSWSERIRDCMVLEVPRNRVHLHLYHPGGKTVSWTARGGDVIIRKWRAATKDEIVAARALTGKEITHVEIAQRVSDPFALYTALRQFGRNILDNILGTREVVLGDITELPGQIDRLLDQVSRSEAIEKAEGVLTKAVELRRILRKTQLGFRTAWTSFGKTYALLKAERITKEEAAHRIASACHYLMKIATFKPFYDWARLEYVRRLSEAESVENRQELLTMLGRAMGAIRKGWKGIEVDARELDRTRKRIARARTERKRT
jgi:transposase-like protein